jgi:hypothetical protein
MFDPKDGSLIDIDSSRSTIPARFRETLAASSEVDLAMKPPYFEQAS